jgi:hypothetical protein
MGHCTEAYICLARSTHLRAGGRLSTQSGEKLSRSDKNRCVRLSLDGVDRSTRFTLLGVIMVLISEMDKAKALRLVAH